MAGNTKRRQKYMPATAKHSTQEELEETLDFVAQMMLRGYTNTSIRLKLKKERGVVVTLPMITRYTQQIKDRWAAPVKETREQYVQQKLEQWRMLAACAWEALEASGTSEQTKTQEFGVPLTIKVPGKLKDAANKIDQERDGPKKHVKGSVSAELVLVKEVVKEVGRLPAVQYMHIIALCWKAEEELLGLYPQENQLVTDSKPTLDWRARLNSLPPADQVERKIEEMRKLRGTVVEGEIVEKDDK